MPVPVFCCFWFQKSYTGNILGIGRFESRSSYFHVTKTESEGESKGSHRAATPCLGTSSPGPAPRGGVGPLASTSLALPRIYSPSRENPRHPSRNPWKVLTLPPSPTLVREGSEATFFPPPWIISPWERAPKKPWRREAKGLRSSLPSPPSSPPSPSPTPPCIQWFILPQTSVPPYVNMVFDAIIFILWSMSCLCSLFVFRLFCWMSMVY